MKRVFLSIIAILCLSTCLWACAKKGGTVTPPNLETVEESEEKKGISFVEQNVTVEIYESVTLLVQDAEGKTLTWRSLNPERLTVDQNGVAHAKMAGTITVEVSDGENKATCLVTVVDSGYIPMVKIDLPEEFRMLKGETYTLAPYVTYNGNRYDGVECDYVATGSITVSNGVITANSVGKGTVTVTARWNGLDCETLTVSFEIEVIE